VNGRFAQNTLYRHKPKPALRPKRAKAFKILRLALDGEVHLRNRFASRESPTYKIDV
jgi:hypothetical protein